MLEHMHTPHPMLPRLAVDGTLLNVRGDPTCISAAQIRRMLDDLVKDPHAIHIQCSHHRTSLSRVHKFGRTRRPAPSEPPRRFLCASLARFQLFQSAFEACVADSFASVACCFQCSSGRVLPSAIEALTVVRAGCCQGKLRGV